MSRGINKVILIGNLGQDPETRHMPSGGAVTNISLATSESWRDRQTGQQQERTEWHRVSFFNRLAEIAGEYLRKGSKVYIEGQLRTRKWQDQSGQDRYTTEIIAREMQMLDTRTGDGGQARQQPAHTTQGGRNAYAEQSQSAAPRTTQHHTGQQHTAQRQDDPGCWDDFDDSDIPF